MVGGPIDGAGTPALSERVRAALDESGADAVVCDVAGVVEPDIGVVDELARARLAALRRGCELRITEATERLRELLDLAGMAKTLPCEDEEEAASGLDAGRQAEGRKEALGVEEERDPADPAA
ncbi:MAG: STAS domain-containing protein [Candidatus Limnocylindria bacterium]